MSNSTQATKAQHFAALHREDGIIVPPNRWDAASACVLADAGFGAIATTSDGPLNILAGPGTPPVAELAGMGVKRVTVGANIAKAALTLVRRAAEELSGPGTYSFAEGAFTQPEIHRILRGK
ncbi:MAG: isocitrate lyase/phosphoenolpyruvate mutase family protein [Candidatus Binatia bacterium]